MTQKVARNGATLDLVTIGQTPIVGIRVYSGHRTLDVFLKIEGSNFGGSIKSRTALSLITALEDRALIDEETVLIESTSGNLGVALSLLCSQKGYRFIAVVDPKTTQENIEKMKLYGAEIELVNEPDQLGGFLLSRLERVKALCVKNPNYIWLNQYENDANPYIHYTQTGPELYSQLKDKGVNAVFVPVSTGGTLAGISRFFRQADKDVLMVGVDSKGSVVFVNEPGSRLLTGIGSSRKSSFLTKDSYDDFTLVSDEQAFSTCHSLYRQTGLKVGGSSGATLYACIQYLLTREDLNRAVCVCPDGGENYENTIYNMEWLQSKQVAIQDLGYEFTRAFDDRLEH